MSTETAGPLVSIITPCLNPGWRLQECIESIRAQTYPNVEHIIVDGGSTDGTRDLLEKIDDVRWVSEPDEGQSDAINKGFAMANGEIIGWLNADDTFYPYAIEKVVGCFADPSVGWSYGDCELVYEDKTHLWISPSALGPESFDWGMPIPQQGWFMRRWALDSVGPLDESFNLSMDFDLCIRLNAAGIRACRSPHTLARFIIHSESKTGTSDYGDFIREGSRALRKAGRTVPSYAALGQACAHRAFDGERVSAAGLRAELDRTLADENAVGSLAAALRAGAYARAGQIESKATEAPLKALRWTLKPVVWRLGLTRRLLPNIIKTCLVRWVERTPARSLSDRLRGR